MLYRSINSEDVSNQMNMQSEYNWNDWIKFEEDNTIGDVYTAFEEPDMKKNRFQTRKRELKRRKTRHFQDKGSANRSRDRRRRSSYTPWSLSEYP